MGHFKAYIYRRAHTSIYERHVPHVCECVGLCTLKTQVDDNNKRWWWVVAGHGGGSDITTMNGLVCVCECRVHHYILQVHTKMEARLVWGAFASIWKAIWSLSYRHHYYYNRMSLYAQRLAPALFTWLKGEPILNKSNISTLIKWQFNFIPIVPGSTIFC